MSKLDKLRHQVGTYTEAVFMHSIALGHGKTHQEAADAIMELVEQALREELRWFLLQTEIDDGRTKTAYMNDLRQIVIERLKGMDL